MPDRLRFLLRAAAGIGLGGLFLWLALRRAPLSQVVRHWQRIEAPWLLLAIGLYGLETLIRAERWHTLLREVREVAWRSVAQVLVVGYAVNNLLPARLGELFRADYAKRRLQVTRSGALGSIFSERLLDLALVVLSIQAGLMLGAITVAQHARPVTAVAGTGTVLLAVGVGVVLVINRYPGLTRRLPPAVAERLEALREGVRGMRLHNLGRLVALSAAIYLLEGSALWACARSLGVPLGASQAMLLLGAASLSTLVPTAPGYLGSYQLVYSLVFVAFGHTAAVGIATATMVQVFLLGALTLAGVLLYAVRAAHSLRATEP